MQGVIRTDLPESEYHVREYGVISKGALDQIDRSPAHYRAWVDGLEKPPTPALAFGKAVHMALLEPSRFASTYIVQPDFGDCRFKENKATKAAWLEDHAGCILLSDEDNTNVLGMLASVMAHPAASRIIVDGLSEVSLRWTDPTTGLACKSRADYWVKEKRLAADLKSALDASPKAFAKAVANRRYHVQDAQYRAGFDACGQTIEHFAIIAVEKEPPYAVAVYTLDEDAVARGYAAARRNIETLQMCLESGEFPSYSNGVETLGLPAWAA